MIVGENIGAWVGFKVERNVGCSVGMNVGENIGEWVEIKVGINVVRVEVGVMSGDVSVKAELGASVFVFVGVNCVKM